MDYLDKKIDISGPLLPTESNCPTRVGEMVENVSDIYNIPSPRLGMQVFVKSEKKNFVITSLKSKVIGGVDVPEAAVEAFEPVINKKEFDAIETELLKRIQGTSNDSSASYDPFKSYPTNFSSVTDTEFIEVLNSMHSTVSTSGVEGFWRLYIGRLAVEVKNVAINYVNDIWVQTIKLPYKWNKTSGIFAIDDDGNYHIHTYYRNHKDGIWGEWLEVEEELKSAIIAEEERAIEVENQIFDEIGTISKQYYESDKKIKAQALGYDKQMVIATADKVSIKNTTLDGVKEFSFDIGAATTERAGVITSEDKVKLNKTLKYDNIEFNHRDDNVELEYWDDDRKKHYVASIFAATTENAGVMTAEDKSKLEYLAEISTSYDLNDYTGSGVYLIHTGANDAKNYPIQTFANSVLRLTVINSYDGNNHVITQVLNINNHIGGEGSIYIRSNQNREWKPWAKLQTNVEVGLIDQQQMDALIDNGIYSGILSTTGETFVIICINNYAIAQQVGVQHISHLKYSLVVGTGEIKIEKRTRDAYGFWTDWENIGSGSTVSEATIETAGIVKLGTYINEGWIAIGNIIPEHGSGIGFSIDSAVFSSIRGVLNLKLKSGSGLTIEDGLKIRVGTSYGATMNMNAIPLCVGTCMNSAALSVFTGFQDNIPFIPANPDQFKLGSLGLELANPSSATKVTWNASSNMNNFKTPGVYEIYGERTVKTDNLPIANDGSGHSIAARLTVVASTLQPANNEICITQFLQLSNRVGGEGATYVRTYNENNNDMNSWSPWQKQMGIVEYGIVTDSYCWSPTENPNTNAPGSGMYDFIDNGIYTGVYTDDNYFNGTPSFLETFTLIVINNYAVASQDSRLKRTISQLKYAVDAITNQASVKQRTKTDGEGWSEWKDVAGGGSNEVDITDAVKAYGLITLINQGFAKKDITYVVKCKLDSIPVLEPYNGEKIREFILNKFDRSFYSSDVIFKINIFDYNTLFIDCFLNYPAGHYYKFIISEIGAVGYQVRVSADMTEL